MYLKEHFVVLNQGEGNFGIHTSAVLLDPIKTFGTNIMLEIYNTGDQPVVNPVVSVEMFPRARGQRSGVQDACQKRRRGCSRPRPISTSASMTTRRGKSARRARGRRSPSEGQSATMENHAMFLQVRRRPEENRSAQQATRAVIAR